jgi:hypothetical protein
MSEGNIRSADKFIKRIASLLQPSGSLFILIMNDRLSDATAFSASFAYHSARFVNWSMWVAETSYVRSGPVRWALRRQLVLLARRASTFRWYDLPYLVVVGGVASIVNCLCDVIASRATPNPPRRGFCSSMFLVLRPAARTANLPPTPASCSAHDQDKTDQPSGQTAAP